MRKQNFYRVDNTPDDEELRRLSEEQTSRSSNEDRNDTCKIEDLEEVYVSDCCCVSRVLEPAIKSISTYRRTFSLFNFSVFIFSFANVGVGLWFRIDPKVYEIHKYIATQNFTIAGWIILFGGLVACAVSVIGICAVNHQESCLLIFYLCSMAGLTILFVGTMVLLTIYGFGSSLERFMTKEIHEQIRRRIVGEYNSPTNNEAALFLDFIQVKMRCCGATGYLDYIKSGMIVPTTCYTISKPYISGPGCGRAIRQLFDLRAGLASGLLLASIVAQLVSTIMAALIFCALYNWRATPRPSNFQLSCDGHLADMDLDDLDQPQIRHIKQLPARSRTPIVI